MTQEELKILKRDIKRMITTLQSELKELEESAKPISPENSIGRISRMDAINNKGVLDVSIRNRKKKLSKLQLALSKVDSPGFGNCVNCKNPINPKRLMLLPESNRCIRCASR